MAHQESDRTAINDAQREAINEAASAAAATAATDTPDAPVPETTLAYGAQGAPLTQLVDLLALLGYTTNDVIKGASSKLDESVLVDLRAARSELGLGATAAPDSLLAAADIPLGVSGELVDGATWDALYAAAAAKVPAATTDAAAAGQSAAEPA